MAWGNKQQSSNEDRPVVIDGRTGRVLDDDHRDRDTDRGQQDRGSARFIYDDTGRHYDNRRLRLAADQADARVRRLQEQLRNTAVEIWEQARSDDPTR